MRSLFALAALFAVVFGQCIINNTPTKSPISGTFSSSGVYSVVRTSCFDGSTSYVPNNRNDSILFNVATDGVSNDLFETTSQANALDLGNRLFVFLLIDASGSQVNFLPSVVNSLTTGLQNGISGNSLSFQNVTMAAAYFDGTEKITYIKDWSTDVTAVLKAVNDKFTNGQWNPSDKSTNLNGAYDQALRAVDLKMNQTFPGFKTWPTGLIFVTGDTIDTAGSYFAPQTSYAYSPFWNIDKIVISSGYRYGNNFVNNIGALGPIVWNATAPTADVTLSTYLGTYGTTFSTSAKGYWLLKTCTALRDVTFPDPYVGFVNVHTAQFSLANPSVSGTVRAVRFEAKGFSKGCDITTYVNSAESIVVSALAVIVAIAAFI